MPWSPIPKFPEIIENLKKLGYNKQVAIEPLKTEVMRITHLMNIETIKKTIVAMERLGYIERVNDTTWNILKREE